MCQSDGLAKVPLPELERCSAAGAGSESQFTTQPENLRAVHQVIGIRPKRLFDRDESVVDFAREGLSFAEHNQE